MSKRDAPATHRNREPILAVLRRWLVEPTHVLEIASGTGQHAIFFAAQMPHLLWQPTDPDPLALASIASWVEEERLENVALPIALDVVLQPWPVLAADAIFNANMIHIAPWPVAEALFEGAARVLAEGGRLFLYGPFKVAGEHTAPSNEAFDEDLRRRDARYGIRDLEAVEALAASAGFTLVERNEMPANNKLLVFERRSGRR